MSPTKNSRDLVLACGAQHTLFNMNSRVGSTSAYSTVYSTLRGLLDHEAHATEALGRDPRLVAYFAPG